MIARKCDGKILKYNVLKGRQEGNFLFARKSNFTIIHKVKISAEILYDGTSESS